MPFHVQQSFSEWTYFHGFYGLSSSFDPLEKNHRRVFINIGNALSHLPCIKWIVGIARLVFSVYHLLAEIANQNKTSWYLLLSRGVLEVFHIFSKVLIYADCILLFLRAISSFSQGAFQKGDNQNSVASQPDLEIGKVRNERDTDSPSRKKLL
ncbi:MAG: hypothetical protein AAGI90_00210 [Chlamydiota bacterium]